MYQPTLPDLPYVLPLLEGLAPKSVLLVGVGFGEVATVLRYTLDVRHGRPSRADWWACLDGIEPVAEYENALWPLILNRVHLGDPLVALEQAPHYDVIVMRHVLEGLDRDAGMALIRAARSKGGHVLVVAAQTPKDAPGGRKASLEAPDQAGLPHFECWQDELFGDIPRVTPLADGLLITLLDGHPDESPVTEPISGARPVAPLSVVVWAESPEADLELTLESLALQGIPPREVLVAGPGASAACLPTRQGVRYSDSPDLGFALCEAAATADGLVAVLAAGALAVEGWTAALELAFRNRLTALAGGPVQPQWSSGEAPAGWAPDFETGLNLREGGTRFECLDLSSGRTLSPAAFAVRADLLRHVRPEADPLEQLLLLQLAAFKEGLQVRWLPQAKVSLPVSGGELTVQRLAEKVFAVNWARSQALYGHCPAVAIKEALGCLEQYEQRLAQSGTHLAQLDLAALLPAWRALGTLASGLATLGAERSAGEHALRRAQEWAMPGKPLADLPWELFWERALSTKQERAIWIALPDWSAPAWRKALRSFVTSYAPGDPIQLTLLTPHEPGALEAIGTEVLDELTAAGFHPDRIPDLVLQPSSLEGAPLQAWLRRAQGVLSLGGASEALLLEIAGSLGLRVIDDVTPDALMQVPLKGGPD